MFVWMPSDDIFTTRFAEYECRAESFIWPRSDGNQCTWVADVTRTSPWDVHEQSLYTTVDIKIRNLIARGSVK